MIGWTLYPDTASPEPLVIYGYTSTTLIVTGDVSGSAAINDTYRVQPPYSPGGQWEYILQDCPEITSTHFIDSDAFFQPFMVGWTLIANVEKPSYRKITAVLNSTTVVVEVDARGLGNTTGGHYRVVAPPGVDPDTGALYDSVIDRGSRYMWADYRYMWPQVGYYVSGTVEGAQPGPTNGSAPAVTGTYYCWNRIYDPYIGRWTTPDPAKTPWYNLQCYVNDAPVGSRDARGLFMPEYAGPDATAEEIDKAAGNYWRGAKSDEEAEEHRRIVEEGDRRWAGMIEKRRQEEEERRKREWWERVVFPSIERQRCWLNRQKEIRREQKATVRAYNDCVDVCTVMYPEQTPWRSWMKCRNDCWYKYFGPSWMISSPPVLKKPKGYGGMTGWPAYAACMSNRVGSPAAAGIPLPCSILLDMSLSGTCAASIGGRVACAELAAACAAAVGSVGVLAVNEHEKCMKLAFPHYDPDTWARFSER